MPERFFAGNFAGISRNTERLTLLSGPRACGKTSLLFQFAFNCAAGSGGNVAFICSKRRLDNKPPFLSQGVASASEVLSRIQMKYIENDDGIMKYFAAFHLNESFPAAVIIDDFGELFSERYGDARVRDAAMVRALALCHHAITHANIKMEPGVSCQLLLSDTHHGNNPRMLFIYKRWIQSIFTINGSGSNSYLLTKKSSPDCSSARMRTAKYSISCDCLLLEWIRDEGDSSSTSASAALTFDLHSHSAIKGPMTA